MLAKNSVIFGRGHNKRIQDGDSIIHAEIDILLNVDRINCFADGR